MLFCSDTIFLKSCWSLKAAAVATAREGVAHDGDHAAEAAEDCDGGVGLHGHHRGVQAERQAVAQQYHSQS